MSTIRLPRLKMTADQGAPVALEVRFSPQAKARTLFKRQHEIPDELIPTPQVQVGKTCVAHAICRSIEISHRAATHTGIELDPQCLHECIFEYPTTWALPSIYSVISEKDRCKAPKRFGGEYSVDNRCSLPATDMLSFKGTKFVDFADLADWISYDRPAIGVISISDEFSDFRGDTYVESSTDTYQHCVVITGFRQGSVKVLNSLGARWGTNGQAWIDSKSCKLFGGPTNAVYRIETVAQH